ncbi:hypothetical protein [Nonomuraea jabiensis]|uniref:hypothetical protein n=1 Tax=Nonomuraea jabiensis TaxID=882448 RepID=UPI003D75DFE9
MREFLKLLDDLVDRRRSVNLDSAGGPEQRLHAGQVTQDGFTFLEALAEGLLVRVAIRAGMI